MDSISNYSYFQNDTDYYEEQSFSLFDIHVLVPVTIISSILFFLGITGNLLTLFIFKRYKEMRTTVNMYLSSMALSDILIFLGLPSDLYRIWKYKPYIFGDFLCKFLFYLSETCTYCTILHITTLSVERYFAICFPLKAKTTITKCRVKRVILSLWVWALLTASPILFLFGVEDRNGSLPDEAKECNYIERSAHTGLLETMTWVSTIYFFLPVLCLTLLYGLICGKLWRTRHKLRGPQAASREKYHKQTVKMLAVVVLAFVLCWLPFHIGRILFAQTTTILYDITQYFNLIAMLLFYLGASINPILYNVMSQKYRKAMSKILNYSQVWQSRNLTRSERTSLEGTEVNRTYSEATVVRAAAEFCT
ncbi:growth hormone secretagogue receptor type 1-like [Chelonoidis abingdonii]|uniref:growth hormone secretagogue receptor type 1-like n=1 Tax=Chelonoidis abingdonii TaxID=106734 RepID=UPI0013F1AFD6|nr:growth hormone secretagogue receptor type 1-like [Chelonoidis abingdonii]